MHECLHLTLACMQSRRFIILGDEITCSSLAEASSVPLKGVKLIEISPAGARHDVGTY